MGKAKNILLIIPNLDFGGAQNSFSKLSVELGKFYNVTNVVFNTKGAANYTYGGPLIDLNVPASMNIVSKLVNFVIRIWKLKRIKRQNKIDVSISFLEGADYVNIFSGIGERKIMSIRGSKKFDQNIKGLSGYIRHMWLIPNVYKYADGIVAVNKGILEELKTEYKIKSTVKVIYNFYDHEKLHAASREPVDQSFQKAASAFKLISIVGRLSVEKGIDLFLPVFVEVKKSIRDCKLLLIGEGNERKQLIEKAIKLGLKCSDSFEQEADVVFMGYQANPYKFLTHCKALILPSMHEGFPNVLVEAMCLQIPVVAADCPYGPREILLKEPNELAGILLPLLDSTEAIPIWVKECTALLLDDQGRLMLATRGSERSKDFMGNDFVKQWVELIETERI